jgi:putative DNA primase/helicase
MPLNLPQRRHIPAELKAWDRWVGWHTASVGANLAKIPYSLRDGAPASTRDPATWAPYRLGAGHENVGFVFAEDDPYAGVDLDDCVDPATGEISPVARAVIRHLGSYAEISPSGRGVKIVVRGEVPGTRRQNRRLGVEMYDSRRFFALTGHKLPGVPDRVVEADLAPLYRWAFGPVENSERSEEDRHSPDRGLSDEEILSRASRAKNGSKFERLWRGDTAGYPTRSEADLALCAMLAYWCGADPLRIEKLFSRSGLCREKWRARPDYRAKTIARAIAGLPGTGRTRRRGHARHRRRSAA